jgi:hypothetical protein
MKTRNRPTLPEPKSTGNQPDIQWLTIKFLQAAGVVYNKLHNYNDRLWAVRYCLWLRDVHLYNRNNAVPEYTHNEQTTATKTQIDKIATEMFSA